MRVADEEEEDGAYEAYRIAILRQITLHIETPDFWTRIAWRVPLPPEDSPFLVLIFNDLIALIMGKSVAPPQRMLYLSDWPPTVNGREAAPRISRNCYVLCLARARDEFPGYGKPIMRQLHRDTRADE